MTRALRPVVLGLPMLLLASAQPASADSGRLHLHIDFGFGGAPVGGARYMEYGDDHSLGGLGGLALDFQFLRPFSIEALIQVGGFNKPFDNSGLTSAPYSSISLGMRFRLLDDDRGYANERGGRLAGNLWIAPHIGWYRFDGTQFGADVAIGYEMSVHRPFSVGPMVRAIVLNGGRTDGADMIVLGGFSMSFELVDPPTGNDPDGDGLSNSEEARYHTNPRNRDTDGDNMSDRLEVDTHTDPTNADTDGDGLGDGFEDENGNGLLDIDETDPRNFDTDGGGISDGDEVFTYHTNPRDRRDDDHDADGVPDYADHCPDSPSGSHVAPSGCQVEQVEHEAVTVRVVAGRMRVAPEGGEALSRLAETLTTGTTELVVYVAPTGDSIADGQRAQRLGDAIGTFLAQHGVDRARFTVRAAGGDPTEGRTTAPDVVRLELIRP